MDKTLIINKLLSMVVTHDCFPRKVPGSLMKFFIKNLSDEERKVLKTVKSNDFNHRIK